MCVYFHGMYLTGILAGVAVGCGSQTGKGRGLIDLLGAGWSRQVDGGWGGDGLDGAMVEVHCWSKVGPRQRAADG